MGRNNPSGKCGLNSQGKKTSGKISIASPRKNLQNSRGRPRWWWLASKVTECCQQRDY